MSEQDKRETVKRIIGHFSRAFDSWKSLVYKNGADPEGVELARFAAEYRELFHKHFGESATSDQMVLLFAYLQAATSAPSLVAVSQTGLAKIAADQGELFTVGFLEMSKMLVSILNKHKNKNKTLVT